MLDSTVKFNFECVMTCGRALIISQWIMIRRISPFVNYTTIKCSEKVYDCVEIFSEFNLISFFSFFLVY